MIVRPMNHGNKRHNAVTAILTDIFQSNLSPGERLRVEHLAEHYGMSVTPIREALVELAGLGLVELQPNRGAVVRPFGPRHVREICHVRRILECEATRIACGRIAPFELTTLQTGFNRLVEAPRNQQWSVDTRQLDSALHELIASRCGNERLAYEIGRYSILYRTLRDALHRRRTARNNYAKMEENAEHLAIVLALASGSAEASAVAMSVHIDVAAEALVRDLFSKEAIEADSTIAFLRSPQAAAATSAAK